MCNIVEYIIQLLPVFLLIYIIVFYIYSVIFNASKPQLPLHPSFPVLSSPTTLLKSSKKKKKVEVPEWHFSKLYFWGSFILHKKIKCHFALEMIFFTTKRVHSFQKDIGQENTYFFLSGYF